MATQDRSALEGKPVTELKEIAKSLDVKVAGLKKAEIIDAIAGGSNGGGSGSRPKPAAAQKPLEAKASKDTATTNGSGSASGGSDEAKPSSVRDESAVDDRDNRNDD